MNRTLSYKKASYEVLINSFLGLLLVLIWLMPVSNQRATISTSLNNIMIISIFILISLCFVLDYSKTKHLKEHNKSSWRIAVAILLLLFSFTLLAALVFPNSQIGLRDSCLYISLTIILCHRFKYIKANSFWRNLLWVVSSIIVLFGILMLLGNNMVWDFFSKYYVNHIYYIYTTFRIQSKAVTFFAAHSISCIVYFFLYFLWEFCESKDRPWVSWLYKVAFIILIISCRNNTSLLCLGLICIYYILTYTKRVSLKGLFLILTILISVFIYVYFNLNQLSNILLSEGNGLIGRYSSEGSGALIQSIKYLLQFNIPTGFVYAPGLFYTDCGFLVYALRGSVLVPVMIYILLYRSLRYYIVDSFRYRFMFISILAFELGYPSLIAQRVLPLLFFFLLYNKTYGDKKSQLN